MSTLTATQRPVRLTFVTALLLILGIITGCATPVGVRKLDPKTVQRTLTANVLTSGTVSPFTAQILNRFGLGEEFNHEPEKTIAKIHSGLPGVTETDRLFALAELSFFHAAQKKERAYFLAAACYAYAFLYSGDQKAAPGCIDPRYRTAVDLYNRSIAEGLLSADGTEVIIRSGAYKLPFGTLNLYLNQSEFQWGAYRLVHFKQAAELGVRGLRNRYRWPGIGAPLTADVEPLAGVHNAAYSLIVPNIKVPVTVFLRLDNVAAGIKSGTIRGYINLHTTEETSTVTINGSQVPLELELSSALAYTLEGSDMYKLELKGLPFSNFSLPIKKVARFRDDLFFMTPYVPGRIPVVLVHGTASSPACWADMLNELQNDRALWGRYQFWLFTYNSGNPIAYSGGLLADALRSVVAKVDPGGKDPALRKMVVIGHSQGGLLTRLMVSDSGTRFWDQVSRLPFEQIQAAPETIKIIKRSMFYTPLPFVKRVVFISTPHQGSFFAGGWIGQLICKFITLPGKVLNPVQEVLVRNPRALAFRSMKDIPRSIDNMDPKNQFIKTLAAMPLAPAVITHSIISVKNPDDQRAEWNDGVVTYASAHLDGVTSELIVHSGHWIQSEPQTIEEVRRILLENLKK